MIKCYESIPPKENPTLGIQLKDAAMSGRDALVLFRDPLTDRHYTIIDYSLIKYKEMRKKVREANFRIGQRITIEEAVSIIEEGLSYYQKHGESERYPWINPEQLRIARKMLP